MSTGARSLDWLDGFNHAEEIVAEQAHRIEQIEAALELFINAAEVDATMEGPRLKGWNRSALNRAWEAVRNRANLGAKSDE
jgi:hypothetical protein